jgi:hypothetical protein
LSDPLRSSTQRIGRLSVAAPFPCSDATTIGRAVEGLPGGRRSARPITDDVCSDGVHQRQVESVEAFPSPVARSRVGFRERREQLWGDSAWLRRRGSQVGDSVGDDAAVRQSRPGFGGHHEGWGEPSTVGLTAPSTCRSDLDRGDRVSPRAPVETRCVRSRPKSTRIHQRHAGDRTCTALVYERAWHSCMMEHLGESERRRRRISRPRDRQ